MLKIYNTLSRKKEAFSPLHDKQINFFVCGITPYNKAHLGHAKIYVQFDVIVKYLRWKGYNVHYLQNVTDIDDKIITKAKQEKTDWKTLARTYEKLYLENMQALNVNAVTTYARATDYIPEIVSQVERLIQKGYAYKITDGYYYDISKNKEYGKLAKRTALEAEDGVSRIDENKEKKNKGDFCLWKFKKEGEPSWKTSLGEGRPGWHIEDTAITEKHFGPQYDIHGGGRDLIFPHHEAEIAQMESISEEKPFVNYWMHAGFLTIKKEKMSKSLGNFSTITDTLQRYDGRTLRYYLLQTHYRKPVDFTPELLDQAKNTLTRLDDFLRYLKNYQSTKASPEKIKKFIETTKKKLEHALDNDFETSNALALLFILIKTVNPHIADRTLGTKEAHDLINYFKEINTFFDIFTFEEKIPKEIEALANQREKARKAKNWKEADRIRDELHEQGYIIDDTPQGPLIKKI